MGSTSYLYGVRGAGRQLEAVRGSIVSSEKFLIKSFLEEYTKVSYQ